MRAVYSFAFALLFTGTAMAGEVQKSLPDYVITGIEKDAALKPGETAFSFRFFIRRNTDFPIKGEELSFSYNGKTQVLRTNSKTGVADFRTGEGKYRFQFYYNEWNFEIYTDTIQAEAGKRTSVLVYFSDSGTPIMAEKPVIYLYPQKTTDVHVRLAVKGNLTFTYPEYKNTLTDEQEEPGWWVTAHPDGSLKQGDKTYNYLFWEATLPELAKPLEVCQGSVVTQANLLGFLEKTLAEAGLNGKESQDFITYWYPRMAQYPHTTVKFLVNKEFDAYAHLDIVPKPDGVLRVFMLWAPGNDNCHALLYPGPFPVFERKGFTVVEWGGMQLESISE